MGNGTSCTGKFNETKITPLSLLSLWSNTGKGNLGKRCRKYNIILIHTQTLPLRLLN